MTTLGLVTVTGSVPVQTFAPALVAVALRLTAPNESPVNVYGAAPIVVGVTVPPALAPTKVNPS